jgi:site-specific DNA-methyltransferase (adenine-specific)
MIELNNIHNGDSLEVLKTFPSDSIDCVVTSPPYYALRDYGVQGQIGLEKTYHEYINKLLDLFDEVKRVLKPTGTCWVNLGDSYSRGTRDKDGKNHSLNTNSKEVFIDPKFKPNYGETDKCLLQIPSRFAIGMTDRGWILRNEIIWYKRNCMPSSVKDRFTVDFEKIFFFTKSKKYWFETQYEAHTSIPWGNGINGSIGNGKVEYAIQPSGKKNCGRAGNPPEGRNKRCVWDVTTKPYKEAHFATYPEQLIETPIKAGCPENGIVLDPFFGSGTTGVVALKQNKNFIGIELNPEYIKLAEKRINPLRNRLAI